MCQETLQTHLMKMMAEIDSDLKTINLFIALCSIMQYFLAGKSSSVCISIAQQQVGQVNKSLQINH